MRTHIDVRQKRAAPKPERPLVGHEASGVMAVGPSGNYRWYASLRDLAGVSGSGESDDRVAWRCPDCGVEADDVTSDCCPRCGSCEPLEYR